MLKQGKARSYLLRAFFLGAPACAVYDERLSNSFLPQSARSNLVFYFLIDESV
jgi:hypothetical protein